MVDEETAEMTTGEREEVAEEVNQTEDEEAENDDKIPDDSYFDDPEGYVDDISDADLLGDILEDEPKETDGLDSVVIVDNIPVVGPERLEKLKAAISRVFSKFGEIVSSYYPMENEKTKGYVFLEFSNADDAREAVKTANGFKLDKNHSFAVNVFSDFDNYSDVPVELDPPQKQPYIDRGNLKDWLLDPDCNDQYSIIHAGGDKVAVQWNTSNGPNLISERDRWTETYATWSPKGKYFATIHQQGVAIWGGKDFSKIEKFSHRGVQMIDFSLCERYLVTCSAVHSQEDSQAIIVWDVRSGAKRRGFPADDVSLWPVFKWSHDGKYFARLGLNSISVYETPSFGLLEKKSIKIQGIKDFCWSPSDNVISYWVPEDKETPARVSILDIHSRQDIRVKNLFNVADCKMYWQKKGDYLGVKVERFTKSKKAVYYNLEIFKIREKEIPVDTLDIKEGVTAFEWEPVGCKFVIIHGEAPNICVSFYTLDDSSLGKVTLLKKFERKTVNSIFWSPAGQFVVLAGLRGMNGVLEFYDAGDLTLLNSDEHYMATDVEWDSTGRFVATSVSWWAHKVDNGYILWSFQGRLMQRHAMDQFCQFRWRPRPPTLLSDGDITNLKKNLKKYQKGFEAKDRMSQTKASKEIIDRRRQMMADYMAIRDRHSAYWEEMKERRIALRGGVDTDPGQGATDEVDEEMVEFFVREDTEIVSAD